MTEHIHLVHGNIAHAGFFRPIQEMLSGSWPNFRVVVKNSTTLEVLAGETHDQSSISIQGRYRYRSTPTTAALPGGLPDGTHPVFVTASENDFSGPIEEPDVTTRTFGLEIKETGKTPATALYRQIGVVTVAAGAITGFEQTAASVAGQQIEKGALSNSGDLEWTREGGAWVANVKANAITTTELLNLAVTTAKIAVGAIIAEKLGSEAVETAKIKALAVTAAKLATEAVTNTKLGEEAVSTAKIQALAITAAKLAVEAVSTEKIANLAVTAAKIATSAVEEAKIADGAVTSRKTKLTSGVVRSTAELELTEAWQDLAGAVLEITPAVKSKLLVVTAFQFQNTGIGGSSQGTISVDGVTDETHAASYGWGAQTAQSNFDGLSEIYEVELTAVKHTIKLRGKCHVGEGFAEHRAGKGCSFMYILHAI